MATVDVPFRWQTTASQEKPIANGVKPGQRYGYKVWTRSDGLAEQNGIGLPDRYIVKANPDPARMYFDTAIHGLGGNAKLHEKRMLDAMAQARASKGKERWVVDMNTYTPQTYRFKPDPRGAPKPYVSVDSRLNETPASRVLHERVNNWHTWYRHGMDSILDAEKKGWYNPDGPPVQVVEVLRQQEAVAGRRPFPLLNNNFINGPSDKLSAQMKGNVEATPKSFMQGFQPEPDAPPANMYVGNYQRHLANDQYLASVRDVAPELLAPTEVRREEIVNESQLPNSDIIFAPNYG